MVGSPMGSDDIPTAPSDTPRDRAVSSAARTALMGAEPARAHKNNRTNRKQRCQNHASRESPSGRRANALPIRAAWQCRMKARAWGGRKKWARGDRPGDKRLAGDGHRAGLVLSCACATQRQEGGQVMTAKNLQELITAQGDVVRMLRNSQIGMYVYPVVAAEFTNWRDEQRAWRETAVLYDQSHHMAELLVEGPDAAALLESLAINSFADFPVNRAKHF